MGVPPEPPDLRYLESALNSQSLTLPAVVVHVAAGQEGQSLGVLRSTQCQVIHRLLRWVYMTTTSAAGPGEAAAYFCTVEASSLSEHTSCRPKHEAFKMWSI